MKNKTVKILCIGGIADGKYVTVISIPCIPPILQMLAEKEEEYLIPYDSKIHGKETVPVDMYRLEYFSGWSGSHLDKCPLYILEGISLFQAVLMLMGNYGTKI